MHTTPIRPARPEEADAIGALNAAAFGRPEETALVLRLRARPDVFELVAVAPEVIGHILFSPVAIAGSPCRAGTPGARRSMGLAPMAVRTDWQSRGVGTRLVEAGLAECRRRGAELVVVLGHPHFYPRFGFEPASRLGLRCKWPVPDEAFMALALGDAPAGDVASPARLVHYLPEFDAV